DRLTGSNAHDWANEALPTAERAAVPVAQRMAVHAIDVNGNDGPAGALHNPFEAAAELTELSIPSDSAFRKDRDQVSFEEREAGGVEGVGVFNWRAASD